MQILYLINSLSKTSVPVGWMNYINNKSSDIKINLIAIKQLKFKNIKQLFSSEIIHGHHVKAMSLFLFFNHLLRKKSVYTVHGSYIYLSAQNKKLLKYIFIKTDKIIFVNKCLYDVLPNDLKILIDGKYKIILNGVDIDFKYDKIDVYKKFNINNKDKIIFHPARFVKEKNHIKVIEAFKLLHNTQPNVKLVLAGDGILRNKILSTIKRLRIEKYVILLGLISKEEVYNFLEKCDLFIMPSISEGLNVAFLEAMTMKTKIVVSNIEQFTYPFEHYNLNPIDYNVHFVNPNNIQDIYNGFYQVLRSEKNKVVNMKVFSLENMFREYEIVYKKLLK